MSFEQIFHFDLEEASNAKIINANKQLAVKEKISDAAAKLKNEINKQEIACLDINPNIEELEQVAADIKKRFNTVLIIGIGGSSLAGQTLCGTKFYQYLQNEGPKIVFLDSIHYLNFDFHLANLNIEKLGFIVISKSGYTVEIVTVTTYIANYFAKIKSDLSKHFFFITENTDNPIRNIAKKLNAPIFPHAKNIGGRYSCFSIVSLLPALICNVDVSRYLAGAKESLAGFLATEDNQVVAGANFLKLTEESNFNQTVFVPYIQKLSFLPSWYVQLFAESLGKNNAGIMPIKAMGSIDQHSVFQLFLDGPNDKTYTVLTENVRSKGNLIIDEINHFKGVEYLTDKTIGDVICAQQESAIYALKAKNRLVRELSCSAQDEKTLGALMMHFVLEVILLGYYSSINPFDQPAVEIGKQKTREILYKNPHT